MTLISETLPYLSDLTVTNSVLWHQYPIQMQVFRLYFQLPFMAQSWNLSKANILETMGNTSKLPLCHILDF